MTGNVERLEQLWAGDFGDAYTDRNKGSIERRAFWSSLHAAHPFSSALEVGCNVGDNLLALAPLVGPAALAGIDVNDGALASAQAALPESDLRRATARNLPFADRSFELVFTAMVLIHQPPDTIDEVMSEVVRCASRFVLAIEYESDDELEVPYRGHDGALFKRPYRRLYDRFESLEHVDGGFMGLSDGGWDDVTWSLFARSA